MSVPELQPAELGGVEGSGYAFARSTYDGEAVKGIFSGVLYKRNRSGSMSQKKVEMDVDVTRLSTVAYGDRLDFVEADDSA